MEICRSVGPIVGRLGKNNKPIRGGVGGARLYVGAPRGAIIICAVKELRLISIFRA